MKALIASNLYCPGKCGACLKVNLETETAECHSRHCKFFGVVFRMPAVELEIVSEVSDARIPAS